MSHPIEALLRPPVELMTGCIALLCALLAGLGPEYFMLTPSVGYGAALLLTVYGMWWMHRGYVVVRYQRNLRRQRRFELTPNRIPVSTQGLYLGRGFEWSERHTQRLHDTRCSRFQQYVQPSRWGRWASKMRAFVVSAHARSVPDRIKAAARHQAISDPGGLPQLHGVELSERDIQMPLADRTGHTLVLGTTRVGKTRALEVMVHQDIRRGEVVIVIDPKGDADLLRSVYAACADSGRLDDFYLFHLGYPEISARYNGVGQFHRVTEVATRIASQVSGDGQSAVFREFVWRFTNIVAKAVVALGQRPDYRTILRHVTNIDALFVRYAEFYFADNAPALAQVAMEEQLVNPQRQMRHLQGRGPRLIAFEQFLMSSGLGDEVLEGLRSAFKYERSYFDKIVASLLPLLEKLTTGQTSELLSPDYLDLTDTRPIFDWRQIVNQRGVVYVGLDALSDSPVASAVGNSMFADLVSYAGERYKFGDTHGLRANARTQADADPAAKVAGPGPSDTPDPASVSQHPIVVHLDEFSELMGDEFIPMINKGGAAGLQITAFSQTYSDIQAKTGSAAKARQVSGNFNNLILFRVKDVETAALLTDQLPKVNVNGITLIAGYNDSSDPHSEIDFTSRHEDRITTLQSTMLEPHDVMKLPKGQAFALLEGGRLFKVRLPLPEATGQRGFSDAFHDITADMQERYRTSSTWWLTDEQPAPLVTDADSTAPETPEAPEPIVVEEAEL